MSALAALKGLFEGRFLEERRELGEKYSSKALIADWNNVVETDAANFLCALDSGLIVHKGKGHYRAPRSSAATLFLNTSAKGFSIRKEDIVAVGSLYRLHNEFGWPKQLLGLENDNWAFDLVAKTTKGNHCDCDSRRGEG